MEIPESHSLEVDTHIELHLAEQSLIFFADDIAARGGLKPILPSNSNE